VVAALPFAIVLGAAGTAGLLFYSFWQPKFLDKIAVSFGEELDRADVRLPREGVAAIIGIATALLWVVAIVALRFDAIRSILVLPIAFAVTACAFQAWIRRTIARRVRLFNNQLELSLRLVSNALRVGLSLHQALVLVTDQMPNPSREEFKRVAVRTNLGVPLDSALDDLVRRVPSEELLMFVDVIKVQMQTGGNLAKILEHLARTIKSRRLIDRRIASLTSEARLSAWIIGCLPFVVGLFVAAVEPDMREAMFTTAIGKGSIVAFLALELLAAVSLRHLLSMEF
jgi:tight adherence protein B